MDLALSISNFTRARNVKTLPMPEGKVKKLWYETEIVEVKGIEFDLKAELSFPSDANLTRKRACEFFDQKKHVDTLLSLYKICG